MIFTDYNVIKENIRPGDMIAFSGKGIISFLIKIGTFSRISHVACCIEPVNGFDLIEATSLDVEEACVNYSTLTDHISNYKGGIYWFPLCSTIRQSMNMQKYHDFLESKEKKEYDTLGAFFSAFPLLFQKNDYNKLFCSELYCGAVSASGAINGFNCSEIHPADLIRNKVLFDEYVQIKGKKRGLKR